MSLDIPVDPLEKCYHEAGHAVVARALCMSIVHVGWESVVPSEDILSETAERRACFYLAGYEAQRAFNCRAENRAVADEHEARLAMERLEGGFAGNERRLRRRANAMVGRHWCSISHIAHVLIEVRSIQGDRELDELIKMANLVQLEDLVEQYRVERGGPPILEREEIWMEQGAQTPGE